MADLLPSSPDPSAGDGGEPKVIGVDSEDADDLLGALQSETARDVLGVLYDDPATPSDLAEEVDTSIQNVRYHLDRLTDAELVEVADTVYSEKGREMKVYAPAAKPLVVFAGNDEETSGIEAALSRLLGALGILGLSSLAVQRIFGGGTSGGPGDTEVVYRDDDSGAVPADNSTADSAPTSMVEEDAAEATRTAEEATRTTAETSGTAEETARTAAETTRAATENAATVTGKATTTVTEQAAQSTTTIADAAGSATGGVPPGLLFFAGGLAVLLALGAAWYLRTH